MSKEFDIVWKERVGDSTPPCPLTEAQMQVMIDKAMTLQPSVGTFAQPRRSKAVNWLAPLAVAASLALIMWPSMQTEVAPKPTRVAYGGQDVLFICNSHCEVTNVISSLDDYLQKA